MNEHDKQAQSQSDHERPIPEVGGDEQGEWQSDVNDQGEVGEEQEEADEAGSMPRLREVGSTPRVPDAA